MTVLRFDGDVRARLTPELAVEAARRALVDAYCGRPTRRCSSGARTAASPGASSGTSSAPPGRGRWARPIDALARPDAEAVAVVGSGRQAWTQLWAATAVRRIA